MTGTLTAERLREELNYDPGAGVFHWRVTRPGVTLGRPAGCRRNDGYRIIIIDRRRYLAHRLAWFYVHGEWPDLEIDHANGDRGDNRIANLRIATSAQNKANSRRHRDNTSGFKGVRRQRRRWQAIIQVHGHTHHLGLFGTPEEAHAAYLRAARQYFGEFARAA